MEQAVVHQLTLIVEFEESGFNVEILGVLLRP
jgi:hypothetical protein